MLLEHADVSVLNIILNAEMKAHKISHSEASGQWHLVHPRSGTTTASKQSGGGEQNAEASAGRPHTSVPASVRASSGLGPGSPPWGWARLLLPPRPHPSPGALPAVGGETEEGLTRLGHGIRVLGETLF